MAEKSVKRTQVAIDPMFFIPEGVDELVYNEYQELEQSAEYNESDEEFLDDYGIVDEGDAEYSDAPETPDILGVVTQTVRTNNSGSQVIDLILLVEDIPGLSKYDFRVTKI